MAIRDFDYKGSYEYCFQKNNTIFYFRRTFRHNSYYKYIFRLFDKTKGWERCKEVRINNILGWAGQRHYKKLKVAHVKALYGEIYG